MENHATDQELLAQIRRMVQERQSKTLFIKTDDYHSLVITLQQGDIMGFAYGLKRGRAAVESLGRISGGSYRIEAPLPIRSRGDLPDTEQVLRQLESREALVIPPQPARPRIEMRAAYDAAPALAVLKKVLQEMIGPVAPILVDAAAKKQGNLNSPAHLEGLIELLSQDLTGDEAVRFKAAARAQLQGVL